MFTSLLIKDWRQYKLVELTFHPRLTVLTGANGTGKTTLLALLGRHFGWSLALVGTPQTNSKGAVGYISDLFRSLLGRGGTSDQAEIGNIGYAGGAKATISIPLTVASSYQFRLENLQAVDGLYIPSHRPVSWYRAVESIPTVVSAREQIFQNYVNESRARYTGGNSQSPAFRLKEALISLATIGYGNVAVTRNEDAVAMYEGFQKVLRIVLPRTLGFKEFSVRLPEVVLVTDTGDFSLDTVSGGVSAIIDMAWQLFMASRIFDAFVAVIDEPENHLHPTLQKSLLPNFLKAFPSTQFIVATHNPFMVTSVKDASVYVLDYNTETPSRVQSRLLDFINKAATSSEVLRNVLGLDSTKPAWVDAQLHSIVEKYLSGELDQARLTALKGELSNIGLSEYFPDALSSISEARK